MPEMFSDFSAMYLDEHGRFTPNGETKYLNDIAGYISYLNREKDARQFAQPIIRFVTTPIVDNMETLNRFDKNYVRQHLDSNVVELKDRVKENLNKLEGDLSDLDATKFNALNVKCDTYEGKEKKSCNKIVKKNIKLLLAEAKTEVKNIRDTIKGIREENKKIYNDKENINGKNVKIIMISPAGAEGITLHNTRQVHILEPFWNLFTKNEKFIIRGRAGFLDFSDYYWGIGSNSELSNRESLRYNRVYFQNRVLRKIKTNYKINEA
jgi:hypothetical protein